MADPKTTKTKASVPKFLASIKNPQQRADAIVLNKVFTKATGQPPAMWGSAIVGYGKYHYTYASGREGDWMVVGWSPRKAALTLYIHAIYGAPKELALLKKLGKFTRGGGCLYVKRLDDIDLKVLEQLVRWGYRYMKNYKWGKG